MISCRILLETASGTDPPVLIKVFKFRNWRRRIEKLSLQPWMGAWERPLLIELLGSSILRLGLYLCEVHLRCVHLAVTAGRPFCGSDKKIVPGPPHPPLKVSKGHMGNIQYTGRWAGCPRTPTPTHPPPTEGLQRPYGRWAGCHRTKGGGLRTAVAPALLLVQEALEASCVSVARAKCRRRDLPKF